MSIKIVVINISMLCNFVNYELNKYSNDVSLWNHNKLLFLNLNLDIEPELVIPIAIRLINVKNIVLKCV